MAGSLNMVMLIGNLGADPEVRSTPSGAQVANFRIACTESWKDSSGQRQERTEWVTLVAWKGLADIAQKYLRKGSKVHIIGKLVTRSWDDKNGGGKRYATEVEVRELIMLDGRDNSGGGNGGGHGGSARGQSTQGHGSDDFAPPPGVTPGPVDDSDLPF